MLKTTALAVLSCPLSFSGTLGNDRSPAGEAWPELGRMGFYTLPTLIGTDAISDAFYWPPSPATSAIHSHWPRRGAAPGSGLHTYWPATLAPERLTQSNAPNWGMGPLFTTVWGADRPPSSMKPLPNSQWRRHSNHPSVLFSGISKAISSTYQTLSSPEMMAREIFAVWHETGHAFSLNHRTPMSMKITGATTRVHDLVIHAGKYSRMEFWKRFTTANGQLVEIVSHFAEIEEIQATLWSYLFMQPELLVQIKGDVETFLNRLGCTAIIGKLEDSLLESYYAGIAIANVAYIIGPDDPKAAFVGLLESLRREGCHAWSPQQWMEWQQAACIELLYWNEDISDLNDRCWEVRLIGHQGGGIQISVIEAYTDSDDERDAGVGDWRQWPGPVKLRIFAESVRQQLAAGAGLRCPFQAGNSCCGLGGSLRRVWQHVPARYRYPRGRLDPRSGRSVSFKPPAKSCLACG